MSHLKVAVRVRPLSERELFSRSASILAVENGCTVAVTNLKVPEQNAGDSRERIRRFTFDYCFEADSTQSEVFDAVGQEIATAMKKRHHSCVLAYGQSSSGKTHTMMGNALDPGLTPRLCENLFAYLQETAIGDEVLDMKISVSYLEIYNEKVRDLLDNTSSTKSSLKVREHPKKGPYVQGLIQNPVQNSATLFEWLQFGNNNRRVAATASNPQSSRSHSVFTITYLDGVKLHLIDLAGSERAGSKFYSPPRFREGANINKSLVALGNVISSLADQTTKFRHLRKRFIPYRDSILTWLLKDTLGGNSKTVMIATVSASSACYSETVNTLRFGQRAKQIVSHPVVNEDPKERTIQELRAEIHRLRDLLNQGLLNGLPHICICKEQEITPPETSPLPCTTNSINFKELNESDFTQTATQPTPICDDLCCIEENLNNSSATINTTNHIPENIASETIHTILLCEESLLSQDLHQSILNLQSNDININYEHLIDSDFKSVSGAKNKKRVSNNVKEIPLNSNEKDKAEIKNQNSSTYAPINSFGTTNDKSIANTKEYLQKEIFKETPSIFSSTQNLFEENSTEPVKVVVKEVENVECYQNKDDQINICGTKQNNDSLKTAVVIDETNDPVSTDEHVIVEKQPNICIQNIVVKEPQYFANVWDGSNEVLYKDNLNLNSVVNNIVHDILDRKSKSKQYSNDSSVANSLSEEPIILQEICGNQSKIQSAFNRERDEKQSGYGGNSIRNHSIKSICSKTDELIPVMEVTSNVKSPKKHKPPLRRTFSVEGEKMERKNSRVFGSQELDKPAKNKSPAMRKSSFDRSNSSLKSADLKKIPEQSVDMSLVGARVGSIRKEPVKPRAEIVQEVTQRLYSKVKKKDASTDTVDLNKEARVTKLPSNKEMKTLASLKLKEITKRAISAYKKRNKETQTYFPPLRVKEISTDSYDLPVALAEVKHAEMITEAVEKKDASTNYVFENEDQLAQLKNLLNSTNNNNKQLPPTSIENSLSDNSAEEADQKLQNPPISFTKYLSSQQPPRVEISNPCTANPIYTSAVNINVSHNYINQNNPSDSVPSNKQSVLFPTPDLISNHNSAEVSSSTPPINEETTPRVRYASSNSVEQTFSSNESMKQKSDTCFASIAFTPEREEKLSVELSSVFAPEIRVLKEFEPDFCKPYKNRLPDQQRPSIVECSGDICEFSIRLQEPLLLKSIMKQSDGDDNKNERYNSDSSDSETKNKKVHFPKKSTNMRMFSAMTNFMDEATSLMTNLNKAANSLEHKMQEQSYEFQINVNDVPKFVLPRKGRKKCRKTSDNKSGESTEAIKVDAATDYDESDFYENKYDALVLDSCDRLEQRLQTAEQAQEKRVFPSSYEESYLHRFPQPFSVNSDWHQRYNPPQEYSSLESNPTHSDYGSLPRRCRRTTSRSPSAYLRHLTNLRQQIVETSREELLSANHLHI